MRRAPILRRLSRSLASATLNRSTPSLIIVGEKIRRETLQALLAEQSGRSIVINTNPIGSRRIWLKIAINNARLALEQMVQRQASQEERLQALQQALDISGLNRIECFDISHTLGKRLFFLRGVRKLFDAQQRVPPVQHRRHCAGGRLCGDAQCSFRRYHKVAEGEGALPDLILIDGGRGQVNTAKEVLVELGLNEANVLGVAKGEERKPGLEHLIFPGVEKPLQLEKTTRITIPADSRRGPSICNLRPSCQARKSTDPFEPGRNRWHRNEAPPEPPG